MQLKWLAALAAVFVVLLASTAEAKPFRYGGPHPRNGRPDGGYCFIEAVHVHPFAPNNEALYRMHNGTYFFIGDPVPFGYDGPRHSYYGHHPVAMNVVLDDGGPDDTAYCYLDGPHFHAYAPPPGVNFANKNDVYYYTGDYPPEYQRERPRYAEVNAVYRPVQYARPVAPPPPPEYRGPVVGVSVNVPVPSVYIGAPPPVVVAPAPVVFAPAPVLVGPAPVHVREVEVRHDVYEVHDQRYHHDNGRHEGEYKHSKHGKD